MTLLSLCTTHLNPGVSQQSCPYPPPGAGSEQKDVEPLELGTDLRPLVTDHGVERGEGPRLEYVHH